MKNNSRNLLIIVGLLGLVSPAEAAITYTITSGASGSLTAFGDIFDGVTNIGTERAIFDGPFFFGIGSKYTESDGRVDE